MRRANSPAHRSSASSVQLPHHILDALLPLHLRIAADGRVSGCGPTVHKIFPQKSVVGTNVFSLFSFRRPQNLSTMEELRTQEQTPLTVNLCHHDRFNLKAAAVNAGQGKVIMNLSLGPGVKDIVSHYRLRNKDFSHADPTADMLFMMQAQSVFLGISTDMSRRLQWAKEDAEEKAQTDSLTGLHNRRALQNHLNRLLTKTHRADFAVMQIDLDYFKAVNDTHGHAAGDFVLEEVAKVLKRETRTTDMVSRIGGDEFVLVLTDFGSEADLSEVGHRIIKKLSEPFLFGNVSCQIGGSIGATRISAKDSRSVEKILSDADQALYASKEMGRGRYNLDAELAA